MITLRLCEPAQASAKFSAKVVFPTPSLGPEKTTMRPEGRAPVFVGAAWIPTGAGGRDILGGCAAGGCAAGGGAGEKGLPGAGAGGPGWAGGAGGPGGGGLGAPGLGAKPGGINIPGIGFFSAMSIASGLRPE